MSHTADTQVSHIRFTYQSFHQMISFLTSMWWEKLKLSAGVKANAASLKAVTPKTSKPS